MTRVHKYRAYKKGNIKNKWMQVESLWLNNDGKIAHVFGSVLVGEKQTWFHDFELLEYIGHADKNGKEIYKKDIVDAPGHFGIGVVEYGEGIAAAFTVNNQLIGVVDSSDIEVIGNLYQNPELLEKR